MVGSYSNKDLKPSDKKEGNFRGTTPKLRRYENQNIETNKRGKLS